MEHINFWPENERPREKLIKLGADKLSNAELLAIFLRTGVKGKDAVTLARDLLNEFGNLRNVLTANYEVFEKIKGMGPAKIAELKAILELSSRFLEEKIHKKKWLDSSENVFRFLFHSMRDLEYELFKIILLNAQNEILKIEDLPRGTLTKLNVSPREIVSLALKHRADGIIFVHNHPSGNPKPSREDKKMTAEFIIICRLIKIRFMDHIIIGDNRYYSFADEGLI